MELSGKIKIRDCHMIQQSHYAWVHIQRQGNQCIEKTSTLGMHYSTIHNSQEMEATSVLLNG
jgi:hypothetical protein